MRTLLMTVMAVVLLAGCLPSRKAATPKQTPPATENAAKKPERPKRDKDEPKAFDEVIKDDFAADSGLYNVYQKGQKVYYEIPDEMLDRELLLVTRIARTANNIGYGGEKANTQVVRWQRKKAQAGTASPEPGPATSAGATS